MIRQVNQLIYFHFLIKPFYFPNRTQLKKFLLSVFQKERKNIEHINYIFCTDEFLLNFNRQFLNHKSYTDIITFPLSKKGEPIISDIYISIDRVRENAGIFHTSFKRELLRVIFHGALHLCGYQDKNKKQTQQMREREDYYLKKLFHVERNNKF